MRRRASPIAFDWSQLIGLSFCAALAGTAAAAALVVDSPALGVRFTVPEHCSMQEGPGTVEAVCDPSGNAAKGEASNQASSLFLEIVMQETAEDRDQPLDVLAQRYSFGQFEKELPGAVCGDGAKVKIENAMQLFEGARVVYTASVLCPEIRFLGLGQRRGVVRTVVGPGRRYQIVARALVDDFERVKPAIDTFLASVRIEPEKSP